MQNHNTIKTLQDDLKQLMGALEQRPDGLSEVRQIRQQLQRVVGEVNQLKAQFNPRG